MKSTFLEDVEGVLPRTVTARPKSRRSRIKNGRSRRNSRRFYTIVGGEERARDTGVKAGSVLRNFNRRGRLLVVDGTRWRWRCGRGCGVVAYSEHGVRRCAPAWEVLGIDPDVFDRGQWKRTNDGAVRPSDVAAWLGKFVGEVS